MMSIKKTNQKGFSLVELLIVIAIMGVLAVIAFNAFNSVLQNSRRRADDQQAKNIERALQTLIAETGIPDITASTRIGTVLDNDGQPGDILDVSHSDSDSGDHASIITLIEALQEPLYVRDRATGRVNQYGPYLANPQEDGTVTFASYAPQWNPERGGRYVSYTVTINPDTQNVVVRASEIPDTDNDRTYDPDDLIDGNRADATGIIVQDAD